MAELVALYLVCRNIGDIARSRGVAARPFQIRAVMLWFVFEFGFAFLAVAAGMEGVLVYLAAFAGALLSLRFSFKSARAASPARERP